MKRNVRMPDLKGKNKPFDKGSPMDEKANDSQHAFDTKPVYNLKLKISISEGMEG